VLDEPRAELLYLGLELLRPLLQLPLEPRAPVDLLACEELALALGLRLELLDPLPELLGLLGRRLLRSRHLAVVPRHALQELLGRLALVAAHRDGQLACVDLFRRDRHGKLLRTGD